MHYWYGHIAISVQCNYYNYNYNYYYYYNKLYKTTLNWCKYDVQQRSCEGRWRRDRDSQFGQKWLAAAHSMHTGPGRRQWTRAVHGTVSQCDSDNDSVSTTTTACYWCPMSTHWSSFTQMHTYQMLHHYESDVTFHLTGLFIRRLLHVRLGPQQFLN